MTDKLTEQEQKKAAQGLIAEQLKIAESALQQAAKIADEAKVGFSWDGPKYGMGGYYQGDKEDRWFNDWEDSTAEDAGWSASSQSC